MTYSPPLDGAAGYLILFIFIYGIAAFVVATVVETLILWRLRWGTFLYSLLTSFLMNLASTVVGFMIANQFIIDLTAGIFLLLFIISVVLEGGIMLAMNQSRHEVEKVWRLAVISNVISYILLGIGILYVW